MTMAYLISVPVGALAGATLLHVAARLLIQPAPQFVGAVALVCAGVGSGIVPLRLPSRNWFIPRAWGRYGRTVYAGLFGGILGLGVLTVIPSIGFYTLLMWALVAPMRDVWLVFAAYGLARAIPLPVVVATRLRGDDPASALDHIGYFAARAVPIEIALLGAVAIILLTSKVV